MKRAYQLIGAVFSLFALQSFGAEQWVQSAQLAVNRNLDVDDDYGDGYYRHCHDCSTTDDQYGFDVDIAGNRVVVGSPDREVVLCYPSGEILFSLTWARRLFENTGFVYLFQKQGGAWTHRHTFWPNIPSEGVWDTGRDSLRGLYCRDWNFGAAVSVTSFDEGRGQRGSVLAGQPGFWDVTRSGEGGFMANWGRALSFVEYEFQGQLYFNSGSPTAQFWAGSPNGGYTDFTCLGGAVSTYAGFSAIGSDNSDVAGSVLSMVKIYERKRGEWQNVKYLPKPGRGYGAALDVTGYAMIVGDPVAGSVEIWDRQAGAAGQWIKTQTLPAPAGSAEFGRAVSIAGSYAAVGAPMSSNGNGRVYVYRKNVQGRWDLAHTLVLAGAPGNQHFGYSVALSLQGRLVAGAPHRFATGKAFMYGLAYDNGRSQCTYLQELQPGNAAQNKEFGFSVAIDGPNAVVGAPGGGLVDGRAFVFEQRF